LTLRSGHRGRDDVAIDSRSALRKGTYSVRISLLSKSPSATPTSTRVKLDAPICAGCPVSICRKPSCTDFLSKRLCALELRVLGALRRRVEEGRLMALI